MLQWAVDQAIARVASGGVRDMAVPDYPQYNKNTATKVLCVRAAFVFVFLCVRTRVCVSVFARVCVGARGVALW